MANYFYPLETGREAWNSGFTPKWTTIEQKSASGRRRALSEQIYPNWIIKLNYKALTDEEANALLSFYCLRKGTFESFYYKDYAHHKAINQILTKDSSGTYQLIANINGYIEPVNYVDNLKVYVDGVATTNYTLSNGKLTISSNGKITADYEYYLKVHFSGDLTVTQVFEGVNNINVTLESVR